VVEVIEDLLAVGEGLDIAEREVEPDEAGPIGAIHREGLVVGVVRAGEMIRFDDERCREVRPGDRIVELRNVGMPEQPA
jgi:voltage-gated potassium channel